jgi:DNA-binding MarR family transcriptional regulator
MSSPASPDNHEQRLLNAERDVQARLGDHKLDFESLDAISNIYRAAAAVRRRAEREVLASHGLSFGAFTILWVLWVWDEMETARLAEECNLAKGTLTGMLNTLEKQGLVERARIESDKRRVLVSLTASGAETIAEVFPRFNQFEGEMSSGLTSDEKRELARLLRIVITNAD